MNDDCTGTLRSTEVTGGHHAFILHSNESLNDTPIPLVKALSTKRWSQFHIGTILTSLNTFSIIIIIYIIILFVSLFTYILCSSIYPPCSEVGYYSTFSIDQVRDFSTFSPCSQVGYSAILPLSQLEYF